MCCNLNVSNLTSVQEGWLRGNINNTLPFLSDM